tara:strand:- start:1637 stop:1912 length:276 start_codon:yes stop_codon:yes gene_type:complete
MSIAETPKRRGSNKSYYHYIVYNEDTKTKNYYKTAKDISNEFGCSRATIYNIIMKPKKPRRKYKNITICQSHDHVEVINYINRQRNILEII